MNEEQAKAVRTVHGRVLVLAGAGSGKTRVIVHRIAHLVHQLKVSPQAILGLTFTNKAAAEMRHRLQGLIGLSLAKEVTLSTFHSFCMQILRREIHRLGFTREFSLYDERDLKRIIEGLTRELLNHQGELPSLAQTHAVLARADQKTYRNDQKNREFSKETAQIFSSGSSDIVQAQGAREDKKIAAKATRLKTDASGHFGMEEEEENWHGQFSKELHQKLGTLLRAYNAVSFDSMISLTTQLFEEHPEVLKRVQDRFLYVMIDEYQDTNSAQMHLAELLVQRSSNLCVVGDDDQSIYGWRGAEVKNILQFRADTVIKLEQNYRSTPEILNAANAVIKNNTHRHNKSLWSAKPAGESIEIFHAPTEEEEAQAVVARIHRFHLEGTSLHDQAILVRSNALTRQFELELAKRGISYEIFGGLPFAERGEIKDLFAYLRIIANPQDTPSLLRIVNVPRRGISTACLDEITQESRTSQIPLWTVMERIADRKQQGKREQAIAQFVELIRKARSLFEQLPLHEALAQTIVEVNYRKAIEEEVKSERMRQFKWENIQECVSAVVEYEKETPPHEASLQHFLSTTLLARDPILKPSQKTRENQVQLMTLHSAKGLEFPICFLAGLEDHLLPHAKSAEERGIEEERRLFYVGITRAQRRLVMSMARTRSRMGKRTPSAPSRFLYEIPQELLNMTKAR